ncbi:hypothetical protein [Rathayibacter sp. SD072]|uniref:hypothetical protein n=1 Tax=Rathayibacter sp. SD072 TaxID=2781731 RepID=UPI001A9654E9|nr:hypothetical protein [Rathayibacter sp. SD072]MBO0983343.1 hypothetical protein [Rathayibacter sp. SD072]
MTKNDSSSAPHAGATFTGADGVQRRTIVAGAAWTVPVVASAIGAPLAAASGEKPTLAFTNGPYTVAACGTLKDVVIKATTDGTTAPPANTTVTVTLPAGLTWSNGETGSRPFSTDANGEVVLVGVEADGTPRTATITASGPGTSSASAPVAVTGGAAFLYFLTNTGGTATTAVPVPAGAQPVGVSGWLLNGTLYNKFGEVVATDITEANGEFENAGTGNADYLAYSTSSGGTFRYFRTNTGGSATTAIPVPTGAKPVGTSGWLLNRTLYNINGAVVATDVTAAEGDFENSSAGTGNAHYLAYTTSTGTAFLYFLTNTGGTATTAIPVPSGAEPVGVSGWLLNGTLYNKFGEVVATDVTAASGEFENSGTGNADYLAYSTSSEGTFRYFRTNTGGSATTAIAVPAGAQPVGTSGWLLNGTLYNINGAVVATDVTATQGDFENPGTGNAHYLAYTTGSTCS